MKFIIIALLIFYTLKLLTKYLGPILLSYISKKLITKFQHQFQNFNSEQSVKKQSHKLKKSKKEIVGDYIDFEEID